MKKIINPFLSAESGKCFACSAENKHGLQMSFFEDGDAIVSEWLPQTHLSGFKNIIHGGIQSTLLDEIACWVVFVKCKTAGVTTELNVRFKASVFTDKGALKVQAKLISKDRKFANIYAEILDSSGMLCCEADVKYRLFSEEMAAKKFAYPGIHAFYE